MATKLDKLVTYYKKLEPIQSHNPWNTLSREITWSIKNMLSPLLQYLWPPNLKGWSHTMSSFLPWSHMTLWPQGLVILISLIQFVGLECKRLSRHWLLVSITTLSLIKSHCVYVMFLLMKTIKLISRFSAFPPFCLFYFKKGPTIFFFYLIFLFFLVLIHFISII